MSYIYVAATWLLYAVATVLSLCGLVVARFYLFDGKSKLDKCGLYMGQVSHTRLKGGNTHHFVYPLFFSFIDLEQISQVGWSLWPIFKLNGGNYSFCSLDEKDHLTDWLKEQQTAAMNEKNDTNTKKSTSESTDKEANKVNKGPESLFHRAQSFIENRTEGKKVLPPNGSISLLAHLTYFGYCFNPISVFYCLRPSTASTSNVTPSSTNEKVESENNKSESVASKKNADNDLKKESETQSNSQCDDLLKPYVSSIDSIIVEVSNTPWIEQHSYMLDESVQNVAVTRELEMKGDKGAFKATWLKEFHVSPFMEMDYKYNFTFSEPKESVWVQSTMTKLSTNEVWFTVNFELKKVPFTPLNLLYVLLFYPFFTRIIQVLIHYEAVKLFLKGIPTFEHPKGTPVEFGFGITDKKIIKFISYLTKKIKIFSACIFGEDKSAKIDKKSK